VLYGLSAIGLSAAGSLWQRYPIHFFYIWMVYWTSQWVIQKKATYLAAAAITWASGMYVFMEIAPAFFIIPAVWLLYRPTITIRPILTAAGVIGILWFPYLQFEHERNFLDLKSQILRQKILPGEFYASWCNPTLVLKSLESSREPSHAHPATISTTSQVTATSVSQFITHAWERIDLAVAAAISNFQYSALGPAGGPLLAILLIIGFLVLGASTVSAEPVGRFNDRAPRLRYYFIWLGAAMILGGVAANEFIVSRYLSHDGILEKTTISIIRLAQLFLILGGIAVLTFRCKIGAMIERFAADLIRKTLHNRPDVKMILLSLLIPWTILLVMVENSAHLERFLWLWPLQIIILAALVTYVPLQLNASLAVPVIGSLLLIVLLIANPLLLSRARAWYASGWFGVDPDQIHVVQYVTDRLDGKRQAAIGYQTFIWRFMATFHAVDPRYKVGADFDLLFKDRHKINNTNRCGEGVSPSDDFRIVQTAFSWTDLTGKGYFDREPNKYFAFLKQFGPYQVFQRQ
jgi:hypothetical protein